MKPVLAQAGDLRWKDYLGKNRIILLSGSVSAKQELKLQRKLWLEVENEAKERDLVVVELGIGKPHENLRNQYKISPNEFTVLLIGKDGGEKARSSRPLDFQKWFALIDTMPMRRDEMRQR